MGPANKNTLGAIVHQVATEKLEKLQSQKDQLTSYYNAVIKEASEKKSPVEKLEVLLKSLDEAPVVSSGFDQSELKAKIEDLKVFISLAKHDVSQAQQLVSHWTQDLETEIQHVLNRCEYSYLYGKVVTDWMNNEIKGKPKRGDAISGDDTSSVGKDDEKSEKEKTIDELGDRVFHSPEFDKEGFVNFLKNDVLKLETKNETTAWDYFINVVKTTNKMHLETITTWQVKHCITGLQTSGLLDKDKFAAMKDLSENETALEEVATLLTSRLRNVHSWKWPESVTIDVRRNIAGRYRAFMDEDVLTAIFLQFIGVRWGCVFKDALLRLYQTMWKGFRGHMDPNSILYKRKMNYEESFLSLIPYEMDQQGKLQVYDDEAPVVPPAQGAALFGSAASECVPMAKMAMAMQDCSGFSFGGSQNQQNLRMKRQAPYCPPPRPRPGNKPPMDLKHEILHTISTEMHLHRVMKPESNFTAVQTDLAWFGPSIHHEVVLTILEHFGVDNVWINFFRNFLETPVCFSDNEPVQIRKRGVPISHMLSTLFGEIILFLLDLHVNRQTGVTLHRIFDDIWFWDGSEDTTVMAWDAMQTFMKMVHLQVNLEKSGSIKGQTQNVPSEEFIHGKDPLPQKRINWGFININSNGVLKIDLTAVKHKVTEMKNLLTQATSVMEWVNIYNKHMSYFLRNFGNPCNVFGAQHLLQIIDAINCIHNELFGNHDIATVLQRKFPVFKNVEKVMEAWIYWPMDKGGLGLKNPLLEMTTLLKSYEKRNDETEFETKFDKLPRKDEQEWLDKIEARKQKLRFRGEPIPTTPPLETEVTDSENEDDYANNDQSSYSYNSQCAPTTTTFLPKKRMLNFNGFCAKRERKCNDWFLRYNLLLQSTSVNLSRSFPSYGHSIGWIHSIYGQQLQRHFGQLDFIDSKLIPMTLINSLQNTKVQHE